MVEPLILLLVGANVPLALLLELLLAAIALALAPRPHVPLEYSTPLHADAIALLSPNAPPLDRPEIPDVHAHATSIAPARRFEILLLPNANASARTRLARVSTSQATPTTAPAHAIEPAITRRLNSTLALADHAPLHGLRTVLETAQSVDRVRLAVTRIKYSIRLLVLACALTTPRCAISI